MRRAVDQTTVAKGKLKLPRLPQEWFEKVVEHHGLTILSLELNVCIAAAKLHDLTVVTTDEQFEKYGVTVIC